jgi:hypothetical protein
MHLHPQQISPGENFDLFYFVRNHTDATTYYVRAVIYDVRSGAVLATQNLSQASGNSRLFTATMQSPADPQALGRNIVAIASVYTDSGYTTKSTDYEEQEQYFLIRAEPIIFGGGGGIDYVALRDIVQEEVGKGIAGIDKPEPISIPGFPDMPFDSVFGAIGALAREINRIPKNTLDTTPLSQRLEDIHEAITSLPEPTETDLAPISEALDQIRGDLTDLQAATDGQVRAIADEVRNLRTDMAQLSDDVSQKVEETIQGQELSLPVSMKLSRPKAQQAPVDISQLYG